MALPARGAGMSTDSTHTDNLMNGDIKLTGRLKRGKGKTITLNIEMQRRTGKSNKKQSDEKFEKM